MKVRRGSPSNGRPVTSRIHNPVVHPRIGGHFQSQCVCGFMSDTMPTYPEAWLAGQVHIRAMRRTSERTREPRWIASRRSSSS